MATQYFADKNKSIKTKMSMPGNNKVNMIVWHEHIYFHLVHRFPYYINHGVLHGWFIILTRYIYYFCIVRILTSELWKTFPWNHVWYEIPWWRHEDQLLASAIYLDEFTFCVIWLAHQSVWKKGNPQCYVANRGLILRNKDGYKLGWLTVSHWFSYNEGFKLMMLEMWQKLILTRRQMDQ